MKRFGFEEEGHDQMDSTSMANVLMLLSRGDIVNQHHHHHQVVARASSDKVFECKTCSRQFPSFQALGGHRASHRRPRLLGEDGQEKAAGQGGKPKLVHECSICGLEFAIGQDLGGHMRLHRVTAEGFTDRGVGVKKAAAGKRVLWLDLNLPPMEEDGDWKKNMGLGLKLVV